MASEHVQKYLNRIESQHQPRSRFMAHVETLLDMLDGAYDVITKAPEYFNLATAVGRQLDVIGKRVGASRIVQIKNSSYYGHVLDDTSYRAYIYARIFANHWNGTAEQFREIWLTTLGQIMDSDYYDNQNMSATIFVQGTLIPLVMDMILAGEIIPKPAAVGYSISVDGAGMILVSGDTEYYEINYMYVADDTYNGEAYIGVEYCGATDIEDWATRPARVDSATTDVSTVSPAE